MSRVLALFTLLLLALPAGALADSIAPYRDFEHVCLSIFARHAGPDGDNSSGNQICKCTSEESRHQGVTVAELKRETAKIRENPKYEIKNPKLLAAFQWCMVVAMDQKSHEMDSE